jgi:serine/threonine-protein kinase
VAIALAHINRPPPPLPAEVPPAVRLLVERALAKDPADRFPDGGAFADAIRRVAAGGTLAAAAPLNAPATTPTQVVGGAADGRTQVFAAPVTGSAAGAALAAGPATGTARPMPPLQAPEDDGWDGGDLPPEDDDRGRRRSIWIAALVLVLLLLGLAAWLLLRTPDAGTGGTDRTSAPATTSAAAAVVTLDPKDYIGKDGDAAERTIDGLGLDASQAPATAGMIADAGQKLAAGEVAAIKPANTPLPQGAQVTVYVVPADDGGGAQTTQPEQTKATTTPPRTTTAAPTTTTPPPTTTETTTTAATTTTTAGGSSATETSAPATTDPVVDGAGVTP